MARKDEKRRPVYCGEPILQLISAVGGEEKFSSVINSALQRYLQIIRDHQPDLSRAEWMAIFDVMNGTLIDNIWLSKGGRLIAMELEDSIGLGEKWGADIPALCAKLVALNTAESVAVVHATEVFWAHAEKDTEEALSAAVVRL